MDNKETPVGEAAVAEEEPKSCPDRYESFFGGEKFIYDVEQLKDLNKENEEKDEITFVKRDPDFEYTVGMRTNMDWKKSIWAILVPWHNEWLATWLYLVFAIYFWI